MLNSQESGCEKCETAKVKFESILPEIEDGLNFLYAVDFDTVVFHIFMTQKQ
jgi:hypothetical protein